MHNSLLRRRGKDVFELKIFALFDRELKKRMKEFIVWPFEVGNVRHGVKKHDQISRHKMFFIFI